MSAELEIRVLGDLQVLRGGEVVDLPPSRKARALLAYLAVLERPQRRERLCEIFWDVPDDPRGALRWSLSRIRSILNTGGEDLFAGDRNSVAINPAAIRTDFTEVRRLLKSGLESLDVAALRAIADRFRGNFLDDLSLPRCPEFEAWRISHVNEMEILRLDVLRRLVSLLEGEPDVALPYAHQLQRLLPEDPSLAKLVSSLADAARRGSAERLAAMSAPQDPCECPPAAPPPKKADVRFCTTRDGVRVAYAISGEGPPLVRAAHWMSHLDYDVDSPIWRHWIRELSRDATLVRYDERGNGLSQQEVDDIGFEAMVADLESIIDASGLQRVVLLGVSQSCAVSVAYAVRHPERVHGLILYGGYPKGWRARGNPTEIALREAIGTLMRQGWGSDEPMFRQLFTSMFVPHASKEQMDWFNELQRKTVSPENAWRLAESFATIDVADLLPQVSVPTLVMHTRGDRVAPIESGREFAASIRGARYVELDSENHILLEDEPAFREFIAEVRRFVAEVTAAPRPARVDTGTAKRPVSVLVADLVSPLHAFSSMDPELAENALAPVVRTVCEVVEAHGGAIIDEREGTVTAAFGATRASEHHTLRACRAARALRDAATKAGDGTVKIRIGIDSGEAVVPASAGPDGRLNVVGPVVKHATRLANALRRDTVALTSRARESAGGFVTAVRMPRSDCPGIARDETVYEMLAENKALSRWYLRATQGLTPLIGREAEREALASAWLSAREGSGSVVGLVAGPGVGKSRLAHEFVGSESLKGYALVEAGADEVEGSAALGLLRRILLSFFGLEEGEEADAVLRTVRRRFVALGLGASLMTPILYVLDQPVEEAEWTSATVADRARRIREAFGALICRAADSRPLVLLVEDLHWADPESCKALEALVQGAAGRRILVILTYRPGFAPPWSNAAVTELRLRPLGEEDCRAIVDRLIGAGDDVEEIKQLVCERADGVPLFIEEIVGSLVQTGRLVGPPGEMRPGLPTSRVDIPASVQSVIAARIDSLAPAERNLLQIAAVVGPVVPAPLLQTLSGMGGEFPRAIAGLAAAELVYEGKSGAETEYAFKHALIHDATYASLTADRRRMLHADVLAALERLHGGRAGDHVERLAHHALRAEAWETATRHLVAAADRAVERSAYPAAAEFLEQAIVALERLPETDANVALGLDIRTRMRIAYMVTGDFEKAIERLVEAQDLARRTSDPTRLAYTLLHASYVYSTYGRIEQALAVAEEARAIGRMIGDERHVAESDLAAAQAYLVRGDARRALKRLEGHRAGFTGRWADDRMGFLVTRSVWFLASIASAEALVGDLAAADADIAEAIRLADAGGRPMDRFAAGYFESMVRILSGPDDAYLERFAALTEECARRAPFPFHPCMEATLGHALLRAGRLDEAVDTIEAAFDAAERANMPHFMTYASALAAVAHARRGDPGSRDDLLDALRNARESEDRWIEVEVLTAMAAVEDGNAAVNRLREAAAAAAAAEYRTMEAEIADLLEAATAPPVRAATGSG